MADYLCKPITHIYDELNQVDIIDGYIIKCYDGLHILSENYLVEDITELIKIRGIAL